MIEGSCACGNAFTADESAINQPLPCSCGRSILPVSAEPLAQGAGAGDFDAQLAITSGSDRAGDLILLGGCLDIEIGKLPGKHIQLVDPQVSRSHAKLVRVDFGPSRWKIADDKSTNGVFVNGGRVAEHELQSGDEVVIGGIQLAYSMVAPLPPALIEATPVEAEALMPAGGAAVSTAQPLAPARPLAYATPSKPGSELRYLMHCEPGWVQKIRLASNLLLSSVIANFFSGMSSKYAGQTPGMIIGVGATVLNLLGAWFLTAREPDVPETSGQAMLRLSLRITSTMAAAGALLMMAAALTADFRFLMIGAVAMLAAIPQFFLFLFFLRRLSQRIPNDAMASQCLIVMIGLPASVALIVGGAIYAGATGSVSFGIVGLCTGACSILIFAIWYLILLIWFQRSLN